MGKYCCRLSSILDSAINETQTQVLAMEVSAVCSTPPRTPTREELDGENPDAVEEDEEPEDEEQEEDEEEEEPERQKKIRGRRKWELLQSWDRNALLESEINAEVLPLRLRKWRNQGLSNGHPHGAQQRHSAYGLSRSFLHPRIRQH